MKPSLTHLPARPGPRWPAALALAAALVAAALYTGLYEHEEGQVERSLRERENSRVGFFGRLFERDLRTVADDLRLQADGDGLRSYLASGRPEDLARAQHRAVFLSRQHSEYTEIRYLDEGGQELMRVNQGGAAVPAAQLLNKSNRDYVQEARRLGPGEIGISTFDLNVEAGRPRTPAKPTLRFYTRIYDAAGRPRGFYIINCLGESLLGGFGQLNSLQLRRLRVLKADGTWLKGDAGSESWGVAAPGGGGPTLAESDPGLWPRIRDQPDGQAARRGGLFTWTRLAPARLVGGPAATGREDAFFVIASQLPAAEWDAAFSSLRSSFLVASLTLLLLAGAVGWSWWLRRRQLAALRESEERARLVVDSVRDYAIFMLDPAGVVVSWNAGAERIKGFTAAEAIGRHFSLFYPEPAIRARLPEQLIEGAKASGRSQAEGWRVRRDGTRFWADAVLTAIRDGRGRLLGFAKVTRDRTEQKAAESRIQQLNRDLQRRAEELEIANREMEAFSYSASHDLRAPLRHIAGFAKLLEEEAGAGLTAEGRRFLGVIADSAGRMARLIDDLLAFSKVGRTQMKREDIDHDALVAAAIKDGHYGGNGRRPIEWELGTLGRIWADPGLMRLVWANLLDNAVKYTGQSPFPRIEIGAQRDAAGEEVYFIRDNGVGFDMQYASKLFGVFQRLHRADQFEGTGIGLANVHRIVVRHGGRIWAESKVGGGAAFFFTLSGRPEAVQPPSSP
ncbi:MAG TPA: ATP-binding protein [Opitutaceae bacterium]|nr:ATP-binding protein [Opitutaceae bacterium]